MAEIMYIWHKTLYNQLINQKYFQFFIEAKKKGFPEYDIRSD